jgi:NADH dehydrogenase
MPTPWKKVAVTGAFGFSGKYAVKRLLEKDYRVLTLTNHPDESAPFFDKIEVKPLDFGNPAALVHALHGADTLVNTYWVRYAHGRVNHAVAVRNSRTLIAAAMAASVRRIVHVSITNPDRAAYSPYFRGKAEVELIVQSSGLSYAILRPAVFFGGEDILINNQAYFLRKFPFFAIAGDGEYRISPIHVDDFANLILKAIESTKDYATDAVGPETMSYRAMVDLIRDAIGARARIAHLPPRVAYALACMLGAFVRDRVVTWDEIVELTGGRLDSKAQPLGEIKLSQWLTENAKRVGRVYHSETARRFNRR